MPGIRAGTIERERRFRRDESPGEDSRERSRAPTFARIRGGRAKEEGRALCVWARSDGIEASNLTIKSYNLCKFGKKIRTFLRSGESFSLSLSLSILSSRIVKNSVA